MREETIESIYALAQDDERVVFIGSDLGPNTLSKMKKHFPDRFFMEGICEQNVIGMAAGIAMEGYLPYVVTISSFLIRRCLEQIFVDACLHHLPLRLIGFGGGMVYAPLGPTHWATDDFALLRPLAGMTILAPCDAYESVNLLQQTLVWNGPVFLRLGRGDEPPITDHPRITKIGKGELLRLPGAVLLISTGAISHQALKACDLLEEQGIKAGLLHLATVKPLDKEMIEKLISQVEFIVTIEEHTLIGGLGSAIAQVMVESMYLGKRFLQIAIPDEPLKGYGTQETQLERYGLNAEKIAKKIIEKLDYALLP